MSTDKIFAQVGGETLDEVFIAMREHGRIIVRPLAAW